MSVTGDPVRLRISVQPSPETNDHEVLLMGDDQDLVARFGDGSIGLDPDDVLTSPCPLIPGMFATECLIGRCDCGVLGCGDVRVTVSLEGELVAWSAVQGTRGPVSFRLGQYLAEVERALVDHSWETPERTVSRHIRTGVDHQRLARSGMKFSWASGRAAAGAITAALCLEPGPYQVLVRIPWDGSGDAAVVARSAIALLAEAPSSWPRVDWIAQRKGLGAPMIAGPGWRPWES